MALGVSTKWQFITLLDFPHIAKSYFISYCLFCQQIRSVHEMDFIKKKRFCFVYEEGQSEIEHKQFMGFIIPTHNFANTIWFIGKSNIKNMEFIKSFCVRDFTGTKRYNISNIKTKINKNKIKSSKVQTGINCCSYFFYNVWLCLRFNSFTLSPLIPSQN